MTHLLSMGIPSGMVTLFDGVILANWHCSVSNHAHVNGIYQYCLIGETSMGWGEGFVWAGGLVFSVN